MTFLEQFQAELTKRLEAKEDIPSLVKWFSRILRKSYRNGIVAGRKGEDVYRGSKVNDLPVDDTKAQK